MEGTLHKVGGYVTQSGGGGGGGAYPQPCQHFKVQKSYFNRILMLFDTQVPAYTHQLQNRPLVISFNNMLSSGGTVQAPVCA